MKINSEKITYISLWVLLFLIVLGLSFLRKNTDIDNTVSIPNSTPTVSQVLNPTNPNADDGIIGVWIAYMSLETTDHTEESFKSNFDNLVADAKSLNATDLFVHTRAFCDALYPSLYYPYSHLITGTQGKEPNFDPLKYMIEKTHSENLKFHAWINPLRVKLSSTPSSLSDDNPYNIYHEDNPYYFIEKDGYITINPAFKEMRTLIANGVAEILENYDVDGIHFDDYFYLSGITDEDSSSYNAYCESNINPLSLTQWRKSNINAMISQVYRTVKSIDSNVVFGISPQGNISNNERLGADILSWCKAQGYIDYICPQIYFSLDHPTLDYEKCLKQWIDIPKYDGLKMYIGLALYKAGTDCDSGTWLNDNDIIKKQYDMSIEYDTDGIILYDIKSVNRDEAQSEIQNFIS